MSNPINKARPDWSRREFMHTVSSGVPTLAFLLRGGDAQPGMAPAPPGPLKFTPLDLTHHFTASPKDFGPRERVKGMSGCSDEGLLRLPTGQQNFLGVPFLLGPEGFEKKSWVVLSTRPQAWSTRTLTVPLDRQAHFVCCAWWCDYDPNEFAQDASAFEKIGQPLAEAVLVYADGGQSRVPIRRRFEISIPTPNWGRMAFAALPSVPNEPQKLTDPLNNGKDWGVLQYGVRHNNYPLGPDGKPTPFHWIYALPNPEPARSLKALRLEAASEDALVVCGLTLYHGPEHPLRYERLSLYRLTLPEASAEEKDRWRATVDLGVIARTYVLPTFDVQTWLQAPLAQPREPFAPVKGASHLYVEITASPGATLLLHDVKTGNRYAFDLGQIAPGQEVQARPGGARLEILEREKVWLHAKVLDAGTRRPTPVRLAFRSKDGRYIPPYGHRTEINDGWFQDYGADLKVGGSSFAYVDGTFQVELPVGEVYVEMTKGFEYEAVRKKLIIAPAQRELTLEIARVADLRAQGWITADTHVHFLSPTTAVLEGQAEGVNLINLLAAQWGDLFTNVGDLSQEPLWSKDGDTLVWVGTENRQHLLGHLALLGGKGEPVYPMSASGPSESYLGDPVWCGLAEWADACRRREGVVVAVHFPNPLAELAADIVLGKIDAVEIWPGNFGEWYRYLNCGHRLTAVGGTDKMGAYMPVGANRTYAYLGNHEFSFANWAQALRQGNTFVTVGPLLVLRAEGRMPGEEIKLGAGGGTIEVEVAAQSFTPFHKLEVVVNGKVVATRESLHGIRTMTLREKVSLTGPGWIAARCAMQAGGKNSQQFNLQAHTSPVYVTIPGQELFSPPMASYLLTLMEGTQTWLETIATRPDQDRFERVRRTILEARALLHQRMHKHGVNH